MTKQEILDHFKNINEAYNDSSRYDSLSRMLDELLKEKKEVKTIFTVLYYNYDKKNHLVNTYVSLYKSKEKADNTIKELTDMGWSVKELLLDIQ